MTASQIDLHKGDCRTVMRYFLEENSYDSIVTDPPYELGFMGKGWDASGIANSVETWREAYRVLKPGGYLLAFGGSRTYHRMACAVEDAGFEIRDQIMWIYGSGFPKSANGEWGGSALKPAHEPIVMARKPLIGTLAANYAKHGVGGLRIDDCRVLTDESLNEGRWPANLIHDGSDEVLAAFPHTESGKPCGIKTGNNNNVFGQYGGGIPVTGFGDSGSAARFFYCAKASRKDRDEGCEGLPLKAADEIHKRPRSELDDPRRAGVMPRLNSHPTVKPTDLMRYLARLVTPAGGVVLDPFMGSGSTGKACVLEGFRFVGIERETEYLEIARRRISFAANQK